MEYYNKSKLQQVQAGCGLFGRANGSAETMNLHSFTEGSCKLLPPLIGPYPVFHMVGNAAVELALPSDMNIHLMFHVSLVRPYRGTEPVAADATNTPAAVEPGPETWITGKQKVYDVERVLVYCTQHVGRHPWKRTEHEYLLKWTGYSSEHNSWEPACNFSPEMLPILEEARLCATQSQ
ncbi:hypothetical protein Vretimale_2238 [Volvox reticuliferus]|uniref:Uncharacterized protein n=1 Tax=Volvox reticuliferus TaxID=1737510 RepID=A0A8J4FGX9_9CHLO|nr:hypothetical protein Vretifemale_4532 [Volvox reticuliferus]GIL96388.1 hypothetical protein Vretimale_2238 [Volvox reticuliferus]